MNQLFMSFFFNKSLYFLKLISPEIDENAVYFDCGSRVEYGDNKFFVVVQCAVNVKCSEPIFFLFFNFSTYISIGANLSSSLQSVIQKERSLFKGKFETPNCVSKNKPILNCDNGYIVALTIFSKL